MQRQNRQVGERADLTAVPGCAERMCGIGDDRDRSAWSGIRDGPQRVVVGGLAGVVDRRDGPRPCRQRGYQGA